MIKLFDAGMTQARINLCHGNIKNNLKLIAKFKLAKRLRPHKTCSLMVQLRGREVRISPIRDNEGSIRIRTSNTVNLIGGEYTLPSDLKENTYNLRISCNSMQRHMKPNDVVYIDDGKVVAIV
jgi:pyruvate kinase